MLKFLKYKTDSIKYLIIFSIIVAIFFIISINYKNEEVVESINKKRIVDFSFENPDFITLKKFLVSKLNSPFINSNYEIVSGDSIQKILKKFKVVNKDIQAIINAYKKYSDPNQLFVGNKIDITVQKKNR